MTSNILEPFDWILILIYSHLELRAITLGIRSLGMVLCETNGQFQRGLPVPPLDMELDGQLENGQFVDERVLILRKWNKQVFIDSVN